MGGERDIEGLGGDKGEGREGYRREVGGDEGEGRGR